nr:DUF2325 domain-containing protein [uncultured Desulfobulbus sp.]
MTTLTGSLPQRKIWEIDNCFKCALIGTCLNRIELRKLSKEKIYQTPTRLDDYRLHAHFIRISDQNDAAGKALNKYLEKKYRNDVKKYGKAETESEIAALWKEDLDQGRIDAAWWGVLTHPSASDGLVGKCYGQLHMISHDCTNSTHRNRQVIAELRQKTEMLKEVMGAERQEFRKERKKLLEENRTLEQKLLDSRRHHQEHHRQQEEIAKLQNQIKNLQSGDNSTKERQIIADLRQNNNSLFGRVDELTEELELLRDELTRTSRQLQQVQKVRQEMELREMDHMREIASLEAVLFQHISHDQQQDPCVNCADKNTANCPGINLCGKTVLYVGGLHKMVPHYRQLVEQSGGNFLHHDGGREASRNLLPKLLTTADAVLCPVDCISHDACNCVKKMCKRYQKPFVLMRSSGLSSLARGLGEIVQ